MTLSKSQVRRYRSLKSEKMRDKLERFLIEGAHCVLEAIRAKQELEAILVTPKYLRMAEFISLTPILQKRTIPVYEVSEVEFRLFANTENPQGILGIGIKQPSSDWTPGNDNFILALDEISDPGNLGTLIRSADWFGFKTVLVSNQTVEITNPKVVRSSMGSLFHVDLFEHVNMEKSITEAKTSGYRIIGSVVDSKKSIYDLSYTLKTILILGNESNGIRSNLQQLCDFITSIPKLGRAESLNVAMAGTLIMSEIRRQLTH